MNLKTLIVAALLIPTSAALAQDGASDEKVVMYDPLFWKDQLKLNNEQCQKIKAINHEYYEKLSDVVREPNHQVVKAKAEQTLIERSEEIWQTFHPKQRKRWKKISQENTI